MPALTDGSVELLLPVPIASARHGVRGRRQAVRAGTVLARRRPSPWADAALLPGRAPRLPCGMNTVVSADGNELRAACDGEVLLRNLLIEVVPMYVYEGDLAGSASIVRSHLPVFVTGSVREDAAIDAEGEVYIAGSVHDAQVISREGDITVAGTVSGSAGSPAVLHAHRGVVCGPVHHSRIVAGGDIRLLVDARQSSLTTAGNVHLSQRIDQALVDASLHVGGGLYPPLDPPMAPYLPSPDRQHVRVATLLRAYVSLHEAPSPAYRACTLLDVSSRGARCRVDPPMYELVPGAVVQLKFSLPDCADPIMVIARVARAMAPGVVGLSFLQMMRRDEDRLTTFCLQLVLARGHVDLPSATGRRGGLSA